jgi:glycosyltransferase involved in cell wall biosynthesis
VCVVAKRAGIPIIPLETTRDACFHNVSGVWRLRNRWSEAGMIHAWHPRGFELAWLAAYLGRGVATGTLHDHPRAYYHGAWRRWLIRVAGNRFAQVVAVSRATAEVGRQCGLARPFRVILDGIVDQERSPEPFPRRVGFLGMNAVAKGFPLICSWIESTADLDWSWYLYGRVAPDLAALADQLVRRYPGRVSLRGHVAPTQIFREIGLLVHASTAFETLGMVLIEAGRAGIPVVAQDIGGVAEVVVEGENGFLFSPDSVGQGLACLRRLMTDDDLRRRMGCAGRCRFESQFTAKRMVDLYVQFWAECLRRLPKAR